MGDQSSLVRAWRGAGSGWLHWPEGAVVRSSAGIEYKLTYTEPLLALFFLLVFAAMWRLFRHNRRGLLWLTVAALVLLSWPPADWLFSRPLEARYPVRPFSSAQPPQAIVVLSGTVDPVHFERPYNLLGFDTIERCEYGAWLYRKYGVPVLVSGGVPRDAMPGTAADSTVMREFLESRGVPAEMIWTEDRSLNTYQNALYSAEVLRSHNLFRIALVVEARSMPRAQGCFRKQGIEALPAPCRFREFRPWSLEILPNWRAIRNNEETLHESVGILWYRLRGYL